MTLRLTVLGSGSPESYARRSSSGYLVEVGTDRILFDCGGGVVDRLLLAGFDPSDVTHLFFSHLHSDHMMDYARLVHAAWDKGAAPLNVWGPAPIAEISKGYFGKNGVLSHDLQARTEFLPSQEIWKARGGTLPRPWPAPQISEVEPGFEIAGKDWRVTSCEVPHAQPMLDCMALRLEAGGSVLAYSGDAGLTQEAEAFYAGADVLVHWCYRLNGEDMHPDLMRLSPTPSEIGAMAARAGVKRLALTHIRKHMDATGLNEAVLSAAVDAFGGSVQIAEDLDVLRL